MQKAEYDYDNNWITKVEQENGSVQLTNNPSLASTRKAWLPLETLLPEGYDARFAILLNTKEGANYVFKAGVNGEEDKVFQYYPHADFSPRSVRETLQSQVEVQAGNILRNTDWYLLRKLDTGKEMPADVKATRDEVRAKADAMKAEISSLAEEKLHDFNVTFGTVDIGHGHPSPGPMSVLVDKATDSSVPDVYGTGPGLFVTNATHPSEEGTPVRLAEDHETPEEHKGKFLETGE